MITDFGEEFNMDAFILDNINGLGKASIFNLIEEAGDEKAVFKLSDDRIKRVLGEKGYNSFKNRSKNFEEDIERKLGVIKSKNIKFIPFTSARYPEKLKNIPDPPYALYVRGELPDDSKPVVAIIGARQCSQYGREVARQMGEELGSKGVQIVSGLAVGIDSISQEACLNGGGRTYGVLGNGVDFCYPKENVEIYDGMIKRGGVISEYNIGTPVNRILFPARNRIISGLADIVLVVEARRKSGTYITVSQALEQGKEIFAVPGRITDELSVGCNSLISQGAGAAVDSNSIIDALNSMGKPCGHVRNTKKAGEMDEEDELLRVLDITPTDIEVILLKMQPYGLKYEDIIMRLTMLELDGRAKKIGNSYIKVN